jgi:DNA-binding MarR family transcriptional regulator
MTRWRYIVIEPDPADTRPKPPVSDWVIRPTRWGRMAQRVWEPLAGVIEQRWIERFGVDYINQLRESLGALTSQFTLDLPDCLPILGYGLFSRVTSRERQGPISNENLPLPALLARCLLAFALVFERKSDLSLAITVNVVRVLADKPMRIRDLPEQSGVSKESISMALGVLEKGGFTVVEPDPAGGRSKIVRLTSKGLDAWETKRQLLSSIEDHWRERFGADTIHKLRTALEQLSVELLWRGMEPYPDGWRASVRKPTTMPHYPMVLHRGGFPDGS